ncbi:MAG: hypothetical protein N3E37_00175 [Candidatus Micrarchaeota archaeon]|nr:hypothetical protein [Candidatus Micrarchaeota archaeon]
MSDLIFGSHDSEEKRKQLYSYIWKPKLHLQKGAWFWWFWLFFIHDESTEKTFKTRQLMILWSTKRDDFIQCNDCKMYMKETIDFDENNNEFVLNGAHASWYYDNQHNKMHEDYILETLKFRVNPKERKLISNGKQAFTKFYEKEGKYVIEIDKKDEKFEFIAEQKNKSKYVGPNYSDKFFGPFEVEGLRIEHLELKGSYSNESSRESYDFVGTAYFQRILVAAPIPQWYWGIYHFPDKSYVTYMVSFLGKEMLKGNISNSISLGNPLFKITHDLTYYDYNQDKIYYCRDLSVDPIRVDHQNYKHILYGKDLDLEVKGYCESYSNACWHFTKSIFDLPITSHLYYNEYPAIMKELVIKTKDKTINLKNGIGNMENTWGFLI